MKYEPLSKFYYKNMALYDETYLRRFQSESSYVLDFDICGNKAFFVTTTSMLNTLENIMLCQSKLNRLYNALPGIACEEFINECLLQEVMLTNDIEGVHSSRQEVSYAIANQNKIDVRFSGLVHKYLMLLNNEYVSLDNCADIRKLYDEIVVNEIAEADSPDGKYFRKGSVSVMSATDKEKHRGVLPENEINACMKKALELLKDKQLPFLIRIAVFHYLFGYIHPFYDGNGRINRFISSCLLSQKFEIVIALRLSYSLKNRKNDYYKAFDLCNDKLNKGDITPFILLFLDVISELTLNLCEALEDYHQKITHYFFIMENISFAKGWYEELVWALIQNSIFIDNGMSMAELTGFLSKSDSTIRAAIENLKSDGIPIICKKESRKLLYSLDLEEFENLAFGG